jgi:hypothetical protein
MSVLMIVPTYGKNTASTARVRAQKRSGSNRRSTTVRPPRSRVPRNVPCAVTWKSGRHVYAVSPQSLRTSSSPYATAWRVSALRLQSTPLDSPVVPEVNMSRAGAPGFAGGEDGGSVPASATARSKLANPDEPIAPADSLVVSVERSAEAARAALASAASQTRTRPAARAITCVNGSPVNDALSGANTAPIFTQANHVPTCAAPLLQSVITTLPSPTPRSRSMLAVAFARRSTSP